MKKTFEKIKYDCDKNVLCIQNHQIQVFVQAERFSQEVLKSIVFFIKNIKNYSTHVEESYDAICVNGLLQFELKK